MAPPSPCKQTTGLSGAPMAAPVAKGRPCPIDPPVRASQSKGFAFQACGVTKKPDVAASSQTIVSSGSKFANIGPIFSGPRSPESGVFISSLGIRLSSIFDPLNNLVVV